MIAFDESESLRRVEETDALVFFLRPSTPSFSRTPFWIRGGRDTEFAVAARRAQHVASDVCQKWIRSQTVFFGDIDAANRSSS